MLRAAPVEGLERRKRESAQGAVLKATPRERTGSVTNASSGGGLTRLAEASAGSAGSRGRATRSSRRPWGWEVARVGGGVLRGRVHPTGGRRERMEGKKCWEVVRQNYSRVLFEVNLYSDARTPVGASPRCRVRGEDVGLLWRAPGFRNRARPLGRGSPGGGAGRHGAPSPSSSPPQPLHAILHQQHHARTVLDTRSQPAARLTATRARPGLTRWATVLRRGSGRARPNSQPSTRSRAHRLGGCVRARPTGGDSAAGRHTGAVWDSRWAPAALLEASARFRARF